MKDESPACSGWTVSTLYTHFTAMLLANKDAVGIAQTAAERALTKADVASEKRFEGLNELRGVVTDIMTNLPTKDRVDALEKRLNIIETDSIERRSKGEGKISLMSMIIAIVGFVLMTVGFGVAFFK